MRRRTAFAGLLLGAAVIGSGTYAYTAAEPAKQSATPPSAALPRVPVVADMVKSGEVPIYLRGIGTVQAYNTDTIRTQVTGQITQIAFKEGQVVHAGDLLVQIEPRPFQAQLDQAIANRDRDQAQLANAQQVLQRSLPLLPKGFVPAETVNTQKNQVAQFAATVKADEAMIESARVQLSYTRITSPINGVTGIRLIDVGNIVQPGDPNGIVVVTQLQPISVLFTLPETNLPQVQQAMAKGPLTVLAYSEDNKTELDKGTLAVLDNQIVQTSGSVKLKAEFPNPKNQLWPGELVNIRLLIETRPNALTVPPTAVQQGQQGSYVYVIKPDKTVELRIVKVAQTGPRRAVIDSGLQANEQVVVGGQSRLQPGSPVKILTGKAAQDLLAQSAAQTSIP
jgi:multidrug efflux system membrane fusion protein